MDFLNIIFLGNSLQTWAIALIITALVYLVFRVIQEVILLRLKKYAQETETDLDDFILDLTRHTRTWTILILCLYAGSLTLYLPFNVEKAFKVVAITVALLQLAFWSMSVIDYLIERRIRLTPEKVEEQRTTMSAFRLIARITIWVIVALLILENATGIKVDALIASLGIGGIAVALAVQNILGDLFSSLTIALDKPFKIGDSIRVGDLAGTVEKIGLKSTRLRSLDGELLVFSNSDLLNSRLQNFGEMHRRRVTFSLGIAYETSPEKLSAIPRIIQEIVERHENTTFGWAFIKTFSDYYITFDCGYYIEVPDFQAYADLSQAINLEILSRFQEEGIEMPYPKQIVALQK